MTIRLTVFFQRYTSWTEISINDVKFGNLVIQQLRKVLPRCSIADKRADQPFIGGVELEISTLRENRELKAS